MRVAIHQPNCIPWLPFFYKMAMVDKFIILDNVQFEKNGFQNRYRLSNGEWITKAVKSGTELIRDKQYADGTNLLDFNMRWIRILKDTLRIETELTTSRYGELDNATMRLIKEIKIAGGTIYITNEDAKNKYLDEDLMRSNGIEIEYCKVPKHLQIHVFEAFQQWGIDGTIKQLPKAREYVTND